MSQALYRKWRPARFEDVVGQEHVTRTLQNSVGAERVGHAYLFCGPRGTGKTTSARLLAKAVNCLDEDPSNRPCNQCQVCQAVNDGRFLDLIEIDAASNTGVDDIRDLRDKINFAPSQGRFKVYIIDEVHMLSTAAFNALLKTLEEPPMHAKFVLATTEEHKVPLTIKSRCQQFNFRLLTTAEIKRRLNWLADQESLTVEPAALTLIARQGAGSIRDAESLLDQLVIAPGDTITLERTQQVLGTATETAVIDLADAWIHGSGQAGLTVIHSALASGADARQFARQMVIYLRQLLLLQTGGDQVEIDGMMDMADRMQEQAQRAPRPALIATLKRFNDAALTSAGSWQPQLPLELAFMESLPEVPPTAGHRLVEPIPQPLPKSKPPEMKTPSPEIKEPEQKTVLPVQEDVPIVEPVSELKPEPAVNSPPIRLTLEMVKESWPSMINQVGEENRNLPALLNMGKPLACEGHAIIIGFDFPIFKEKFLNTPGASDTIGKTFSSLLHADCIVRAVVTSDYTVPIAEEEFRALAEELGGVVREEE